MIARPEPLRSILDLARWAPSGDNLQPWRFEILGPDRIRLHVRREQDIYDFGGAATQASCGVMLETLRLAASRHHRGMTWAADAQTDEHTLRFAIEFPDAPAQADNPLAHWIEQRSVDRRPYRWIPLSSTEKSALQSAVGNEFRIRWFETLAARWAVTRLNARATWIRLSIPETFAIHQRIIDWERDQSPDRVPARAVGLDPMTRRLMQWVLEDWARARFLNRFLAGPLTPVLEMDVVPGLACGAHFIFALPHPGTRQEDTFLAAGQAMQRFWLQATALGLAMQPAFATLAFNYYGERGTRFSALPASQPWAALLSNRFHELFGLDSSRIGFIGRIGRPHGQPPVARSTRRPLDELLLN